MTTEFVTDYDTGSLIESVHSKQYALAVNTLEQFREGTRPNLGNQDLGGYSLENLGGGSPSAPSLSFDGDGDTGLMSPEPDSVVVIAGGVERARFHAAGVTVPGQVVSTLATGTAPFNVASATKVDNLNADLLDGNDASAFAAASHTHDASDIVTGILPVPRGGTGQGASPSTGQLLIGNGTGFTLNGLQGTANQVNVVDGPGSITLSAPQNLHTAATPRFQRLGLGADADSSVALTTTGQAAVQLVPEAGASAGQTGELRFRELPSNGVHFVALKAPDNVPASQVFTLPAADGTSGQVLRTDGSGGLSWSTVAASSHTHSADDIVSGVLAIARGGTGSGSAPTNGQLLIGNGASYSLNTLSGTANQVSVANGAGSILLSTPQDLHSGATPQFARLGLGAPADASALLTLSGQAAVLVEPYGAAAGNTGEVRFRELAANGSSYVGLKAPDAIPASRIWTLPAADGSAGQVLGTDGSGALAWYTPTPASHTHDASDIVSGVLAVARGGTGVGTSPADGQLLVGNGTTGAYQQATLTGTANRVTVTNGAGSITLSGPQDLHTAATPEFARLGLGQAADGTVLLSLKAQAAAQLLPADGAGAGQTAELRFRELASNGSNHVGFKAPDLVPADRVWTLPSTDGTSGQALKTDGSGGLGWASFAAASHTHDAGDIISGTLAVERGGTGQSSYAKGDLLVATGATTLVRVTVGNDSQVLTADSTQVSGVRWTAPPASATVQQLWKYSPGSAQTFNSTSWANVTGAEINPITLAGGTKLYTVSVGFEAVANHATRLGFFRLEVYDTIRGTTTVPSSSGFDFVSPYNLAEVGSQCHTFVVAGVLSSDYRVRLQAKLNTSGDQFQVSTNCYLSCSVVEV